jgi:hypothetical protein
MRKQFDSVLLPGFDDMRETCRKVVERAARTELRVDEFFQKILAVEQTKVDLVLYKEEMRDFNKILDKVSFEHDKALNSLQ